MCTMLMRLLAMPETEEIGRVGDRVQREAAREREGEREEAPNPIPSLNDTCSLVLGLGQLRLGLVRYLSWHREPG
jgi:hypothetical protein